MGDADQPALHFGPFQLDPAEQRLLRDGEPVALTPKAFELLVCLVQHQGRLVSKEDLLRAVWPDTFVEEAVLTVNMSAIRKALGDDRNGHTYIETVPRRGYRFVAPVLRGETGAKVTVAPRRFTPKRVAWIAAPAIVIVALASALFANRPYPPRPVVTGSVAVLPLRSLSSGAAQEEFADAMTEMLITELGQVPALKVVSRQSILQYAQSRKSMPQIARELNVEYLAEGTVGRDGQHVRITAQLIHGATDRHVWAQSYERDLGSTFALQSDVAGSIAREIGIKLATTPARRVRASVPQAAYEAYLRAGFLLGSGPASPAIEQFRQAIDLDPSFAEAYAAMANAYFGPAFYGGMRPNESWPNMRDAALKAIELDDSLASAHAALALAKMHYDWDWQGAEREFKRSLQLNPNDSDVRHLYAHYLLTIGRPTDSLAEMSRAFEIDPVGVGTAT
jgi:DNA-binding winged helix-turn-helix (wHTH) protein/TolB-like protein